MNERIYNEVSSFIDGFRDREPSSLQYTWHTRKTVKLYIWAKDADFANARCLELGAKNPDVEWQQVYDVADEIDSYIHEELPGIEQKGKVTHCQCPFHKGHDQDRSVHYALGELWVCYQCHKKFTLWDYRKKPRPYKSFMFDLDKGMRRVQRNRMTQDLRWRVLARDGYKCRACGRSADDGAKLHVDHIHPVSKGGTSDLDNLQTLCAKCNLGKSDKIIDLPGA